MVYNNAVNCLVWLVSLSVSTQDDWKVIGLNLSLQSGDQILPFSKLPFATYLMHAQFANVLSGSCQFTLKVHSI